MWRMALRAGKPDGWARLADEFEGHGTMELSGRYMTAHIGWMAYKSCVRVGTSSEGLTLRVEFPFQLGHPDLFIPWTRLKFIGLGTLGLSVRLLLDNDDVPINISFGLLGGAPVLNAIAQQYADAKHE